MNPALIQWPPKDLKRGDNIRDWRPDLMCLGGGSGSGPPKDLDQ